MPLVRILVLALLVQALGVGELLAATCADDCAEQDCGDGRDCAPVCPTCHCCTPRLPMTADQPVLSVALVDLAIATVIAPLPSSPRPGPEPDELLRPPIA